MLVLKVQLILLSIYQWYIVWRHSCIIHGYTSEILVDILHYIILARNSVSIYCERQIESLKEYAICRLSVVAWYNHTGII